MCGRIEAAVLPRENLRELDHPIEGRGWGLAIAQRRCSDGKFLPLPFQRIGKLALDFRSLPLARFRFVRREEGQDHGVAHRADRCEAVQQKLVKNRNRKDTRRSHSQALLLGKIFDDRNNKMSPSHALKKGVRYRYYVSSVVAQGRKEEAGSIQPVPAPEIEKLVIDALRQHVCKEGLPSKTIDKEPIETLLHRVEIRSQAIEVTLAESPESAGSADPPLLDDDDQAISDPATTVIDITWVPQPHRRRREIILPEQAKGLVQPIRSNERFRLLRAIAQGRKWLDNLIDGACPDIKDLAKREGKTERTIRMIISLALLDPALV